MKGLGVLLKRGILSNKARTIFAVASIVIAVTVMVSLNIAVESIKTNLKDSFDERTLGADVIINTGTISISDNLVKELKNLDSTSDVYSRVKTWSIYQKEKKTYWIQLLGIDFAKEQAIESYKLLKGSVPNDNEVLVSQKFARSYGFDSGDKIPLRTDKGSISLKISGILSDTGLVKENSRILLMKSTNLKSILNVSNNSEVSVNLKDGIDPLKERDRIQKIVGDGISVYLPRDKSEDVVKSLDSLFIGFNIFAALAFFIGIFLINSTVGTIVMNSSAEIAIMKVFGYRRKDVFIWILALALTYGVVGGAIGLVMGILLSNGMMGLIKTMVNTNADTVIIPWARVIVLSLIGVGVAVFSGFNPALRASKATISEGLAWSKFRKVFKYKKSTVLFCVLTVLSVLSVVGSYFKLFSKIEYVAFGFIVFTLYFLLLLLIRPVTGLIYRVIRVLTPLNGYINFVNMTTNVNRTANTIFAIIICISMSVGLGGVLGSFKGSMLDQVKTMYNGDVLVSATFGIDNKDLQKLQGTQDVKAISPIYEKSVISDKKNVFIYGIDIDVNQMKFTGDKEEVIREKLKNEDSVVISKTLAYKWKKEIGDVLDFPTDSGSAKFKIAGFTKTPDQNAVEAYMSSNNFKKYYPSSYSSEYLVIANKGADLDKMVKTFEGYIKDDQVEFQRIDSYINDTKNELDNSFSVFYFLIFIAYIVGGLVIINSMKMNIREMRYQLSLLKAFGLKKSKMFLLMLDMGFIYGLIGTLAGALFGTFINFSLTWLAKDIMGLELEMVINLKEMIFIIIGGIAISVIASIIPALRAYKVRVVEILRNGENYGY